MNRRHLGNLALGAGAAALGGCAFAPSKLTALIATDVPSLQNLYGIAKGIGQVALVGLAITDPPAAAAITAGIALVDGYIAAGSTTVAANASTVVSTTNAILAAAAPAITAVRNSST